MATRKKSLTEGPAPEDILHRLAVDGRAQYEGRGRGVRWSLVETRPVPPPVEACPVVAAGATDKRPLTAADVNEAAVATAHEFRAIAKALGLGPSATAGEIADAVRAVGAERDALRDRLRLAMLTGPDDQPQGGVEAGPPLSGREAARRCHPLGGADAQALEGALQLTERERDEAREEAAGWRARAERALAEGQAAAAQLEGKRLEVLDRSRAHADMVEAVTRALGGDTDEPMSDEALVALARMTWESLTNTARLAAERDEARAQRDEARGQRDAVQRRAEATNDALWELRKKARRKLERAQARLADAQNGLDIIVAVPLADDGIPF